jgi:hypothetical protein
MAQGSRRPDPYLWEIPAWTGSAVETLRMATHTIATAPSDTPANTIYKGLIRDAGLMRRAVFEQTATQGKANVDLGFIEFNNTGELDAWLNYGWGRVATLKMLSATDAPVAGATILLKAMVAGIETANAPRILRLRLKGRMAELDKPLLTSRYLGTTTSGDAPVQTEGDADLAGQIKPYIFGSVANVSTKLVSKFKLLYQVAANAVGSIIVYDGGIALTNAGDFGSVSALLNATVASGSYATCLAAGVFKLGAPAAFAVTADVVEGATLSVRSAARVIQRMLALVPTIAGSDIVTSSFDSFHAFNPAEIGIYIDSDAAAIDVISQVADSVGGAVLDTALGQFQAVWITTPSAPVDATYALRDLLSADSMQMFAGPSSEGQGVPAWSVIVNWGRIWQTQGSGDLAPRIAEATDGTDLARKQLLANATRQATTQDASVQTAHPQAVELTFDTLLTQQADAQAEASRRSALYKVRRDRITFPISFASDASRGNIELGRSVKLTINRFGYNAGKNFLVLGREDNFTKKVRTLTLWG